MTPFTTQLDEQTRATIADLPRLHGVTESEFASEAIRRVAKHDAGYRAFVQAGIDAADRGEVISQAEMERWFEARIADAGEAGGLDDAGPDGSGERR